MVANFYDCIYERLLKSIDDELIVWPGQSAAGRSYTGEAILNRVAAIRTELSKTGVQPGQQVLLAIPVTFDLICTLLAIMAMGAIPVLPPAASSLRTLLSLMMRENMSAVITRRKPPFLLHWLAKRTGIVPFHIDSVVAPSSAWLPPQPVDPDQPALISHSSGSTGTPKSVRRSHRVLLAQHQALSTSFPPWPGQRDFPLFPNILLHNLAVGTISILPDLPGFAVTQMDPACIVRQLVEQRVQTLTGNVYYFQKLLQYLEKQSLTFPDVRAIGIGGSPVPESLAHSLKKSFAQADIYVIYGSSEAEPIAVRKTGPTPKKPRAGYAVGTIHPALHVQIQPVGVLIFSDGTSYNTGEIEVKGAHVATAGNEWFRTGDFGYFNAQQLFLTGRRGNERIHQGVQHYQVEHMLSAVNGVKRVAARSTESGFTVYIEGNPSKADLWKTLTENFPMGIVDRICFRKTLPVDARHQSKIRYDRLK